MKAPLVAFVSTAWFALSVSAEESVESKAETLVNEAVKKLKSNDYPEVWKSFSAKSKNRLRLSMLSYLQLREDLARKHPEKKAEANNPEPTPFEKLQMENDPGFRKEDKERRLAVEYPSGWYTKRMLQQWGFKTNLEETAKLSNEQFWKTFVEHLEDRAGESFHPFMANDARLEMWKGTPTEKWTHQITSITEKDGKVSVETTVPRYDYFHGSYRELFLLYLPMDPKDKEQERFPFTWSGTIQDGKLVLDVPPPVLENLRRRNEDLSQRLREP